MLKPGIAQHAERIVRLTPPVAGVRQLRLVAQREAHGRAWASCAEFGVLVD